MNHWKPSRLAIPLTAESVIGSREEALREFNISRKSVGGIDETNRIYEVEAEDPNSVSPFLRSGMQKDYRNRALTERTYLVLQGGDTLYHTEQDTAHRQPSLIPDEFRAILDRQERPSRVRNHNKVGFPERGTQLGHTPKGEGPGKARGGWP